MSHYGPNDPKLLNEYGKFFDGGQMSMIMINNGDSPRPPEADQAAFQTLASSFTNVAPNSADFLNGLYAIETLPKLKGFEIPTTQKGGVLQTAGLSTEKPALSKMVMQTANRVPTSAPAP